MELPQAGYGDQLSGERVQLNNEVRPTDQDTFHSIPARLVLDPQLEEEHRELLHGRQQQEGAGLRDLTEMEDRYDCSYGWTMIFQCIMTSWMIIPARAHIKRYLATSKHSFESQRAKYYVKHRKTASISGYSIGDAVAIDDSECVFELGELRNVWGFIDGTIRRIGKPLGNAEQHALYSGHKRCHGIKFQSVTTPDGIISHLFGPAEGRLHDLTLLDASGLEETIQNNQRFDGYLLYGDPAYGHTDVFASPFDRIGATREESEVNASMSRVRITVEWGFGQVIDE
ncbi:hypothetical protein L914_06619 [Phytophthora nicotianae]|uniref:DDE Tnp4 domain-containing protein n=2 Tax=Phytophthora nicotianae TaxID=4792 RepID=W2NMJ7_PHYNI|nr:hypothetical protein L914_06619 [Phytophthora nicotianae]